MKNYWDSEANELIADILSQLVKIDTVNAHHNETAACEYIKKTFSAYGIESTIYESAPGRGNIYAHIPSDSEKKQAPAYVISHLDVVDAVREKWSFEPFCGEITDGKLLGRGTLDTLQLTAAGMAAMILIKKHNIKLNRDIRFIATADEENGSKFGMQYLTENHPELFERSYIFNEGGGFVMKAGDNFYRTICCGEKGVIDVRFTLRAKDYAGGFFSDYSMMRDFTEIVRRIAAYKSPRVMCSINRRFEAVAGDDTGRDVTLNNLHEYSTHNSLGLNAFNQRSVEPFEVKDISFIVSFRFVPGVTEEEQHVIFKDLMFETKAYLELSRCHRAFESDIDSPFLQILGESACELEQEDVKLLPMLALGNTDGRFIGTNIYGFTPLLSDMPFSEVLKKVHQTDEFITLDSLHFCGQVLFNAMVRLGETVL